MVEIEQPTEEMQPVRKQKRVSKSLSQVLGGEYLSRRSVMDNLSFLVYLAVLAMLYIGNTYYAEKTFKDIEKIKTEMKEYRAQYITAKSALMNHSRLSEIEKRANVLGLRITTLPPYKIFYSKSSVATSPEQTPPKP